MRAISIPNATDEVLRALHRSAGHHGRSTDAGIGDIPEQATRPAERVLLGTLLAEMGRQAGLDDDEAKIFDGVRDRTPAEPPDFG